MKPIACVETIPLVDASLRERLTGLDTAALLGTGVRTAAARGLGPLCAFLTSLLLAHSLGPAGIGEFYVAATIMALGAILARFGLDTALQRFAGAAMKAGDIDAVCEFYRQAIRISGLCSLAVCAGLLVLSEPLAIGFGGTIQSVDVFRIMALAIVPFTVLGTLAAMLKSIGQAISGGFFEVASMPVLALVGVAISSQFFDMSVAAVAWCYLLASSLAAIAAWNVLRGALPLGGARNACRLPIRQVCLPLAVVELANFTLLWAPFLVLAALSAPDEAGLYNVAHRVAAQLGVLTLAFGSIAAPRFAAQHVAHDREGLTALSGRATRSPCVLGLPIAIAFALYPEIVLRLFGEPFVGASTALKILAVGQIINLLGPAGYLLAMTGHERVLRNAVLSTLALTLVLATLLIPELGAIGAALAVAIPGAIHRITCCVLAARRLRVPYLLVLS